MSIGKLWSVGFPLFPAWAQSLVCIQVTQVSGIRHCRSTPRRTLAHKLEVCPNEPFFRPSPTATRTVATSLSLRPELWRFAGSHPARHRVLCCPYLREAGTAIAPGIALQASGSCALARAAPLRSVHRLSAGEQGRSRRKRWPRPPAQGSQMANQGRAALLGEQRSRHGTGDDSVRLMNEV